NGMVTVSELSSNVLNVTTEIIASWDKSERLLAEHIVKQTDRANTVHFIDAYNLIPLFAAAINGIKNVEPSATSAQRDFIHLRAETLYHAAKQVLHYATAQTLLGVSDLDLMKLSQHIEEYEAMVKKAVLQQDVMKANRAAAVQKKGRPFFLRVLSFISSIFGIFSHQPDIESSLDTDEQGFSGVDVRREPRKETKDIFEKANARRGPIVALSDLIELTPENDAMINRIVQELRDNNMKIVIPVFNARTVLYPKRSNKLLMSDTEYLLVPPPVIKSIDTISEYVNSLVGHKLKDEVIPGRGLVMLEKYLKVLHRQRRLSQLRKREDREKNMKR
ncbi:MAG TPA: hypothetical protein VF857_05270, partial [Spirochaetota bacterium]